VAKQNGQGEDILLFKGQLVKRFVKLCCSRTV
jgi:hypothetical protein